MTPSWDLCSCVLSTAAFPDRHTGPAIALKLQEIIANFKVDSTKVKAIVHDQAANMELSLSILQEHHSIESVRCSGHCLQLCLKAALSINAVDQLLGAARKLVGHFKHSIVATEELKRRQTQMEVAQKKLIQDCATRWNSAFYMLERLVEMRWPICAVLSDDTVTKRDDRYLELRTEQWDMAKELVATLKPFEVATTFLGYEENTTISVILPVIFSLVEGLKECSEDSATLKQFKSTVQAELTRRWLLDSLDLCSSPVLAAAVDPRFKQLKFLKSEQVTGLKAELETRMLLESTPEDDGREKPPDTVKRHKPNQATAIDILLGPDDDSDRDLTAGEELDQYFAERAVSRQTKPLEWWKDNAKRFPRLAVIAQSLLCIPAT